MTVPMAYDSQLMFPEFENMRGTIRAAVMVGDMTPMFWARSSVKLRTPGLRRGSEDPEVESISRFMVACG
jgi:hypothetical protein